MRRLLLLILPALHAFAAEPFFFIQASDPQFGMFAEDRNFTQETANWEFAVANINRLKPAFVVVTGDLTNGRTPAEIAEYKRINAKISKSIHVYSAPGNHDVTNTPTASSLAEYRREYGPDYFSFTEGSVYGIVLNSSLFKAPENVTEEAAKQERWLDAELGKASGKTVVIFQHIPFFLEHADEADQYFNIPKPTRERVLALLHRHGVRYIFAGHYHRNAFGKDGDMEMITTGPAGMPIGPDPSGFRIAEVKDGRVEQDYYSLGTIPNVFPIPPKKKE